MSRYKYLPSTLAEALTSLGLSVRRPVHGFRAGLHRSPHHGASVEFAEYRPYTPGDPTSLIDWPVYARTDKYMIRQCYEETNLRATILLDTSGSLAFRDEGRVTKMEYGCFLAAGLMYMLVNQRDSVGLMTFDRRLIKGFPAVGTSEGLRPVLEHLETVRPSGAGDIEAAIHEATTHIGSKSLVILISDLLQDAERILRGIRHLYHDGHNIMVLHVMDRGERRLSFGGVADLRDLETRRRLVVDVDEVKEAYREAVLQHLDTLRSGCAECLATYQLMETSQPVETSLSKLGS
ncbi:MAG: hypothetical protein A2498_05680 [Lentisphaerae bacterium RIFOXYC12_FULL_60_16]|nr:MAG: hypothetical protein A2498_05680 [Lentisphaerae bacterium RIFOXYC12_FULL_60_16]OGV84173.1 MAG: hypothetical protein A2340_13515 [Lentisphaerae bacterium RIFOXYB12_FULL_60_10]